MPPPQQPIQFLLMNSRTNKMCNTFEDMNSQTEIETYRYNYNYRKKIEGQYLILFGCVSVGKITYDQQYAKGRKKFPEEVKPKRNLSNQNNYDGNEISTVMSLKKFEMLICLFFRFYKKNSTICNILVSLRIFF